MYLVSFSHPGKDRSATNTGIFFFFRVLAKKRRNRVHRGRWWGSGDAARRWELTCAEDLRIFRLGTFLHFEVREKAKKYAIDTAFAGFLVSGVHRTCEM